MNHSMPRPQSPKPWRGFTLVELMVTLTVLAILLSLAAPSFSTLVASNRITTEANELIGTLNLTRAEAIRRAQAVTMRSDNNDNYAKGWHVFPDGDVTDGAPANPATGTDGQTLRVASAFSGTATITRVTRSAPPAPFTYTTTTATDRMYVTFTSRGAINATAAAFFRICDPSNPTVKGRIVQVNVVGKITLDDTNATCS
ncbi:MAG TPA: GspH/FimT family pseudopilin [Burkholderiaceae bacterium]|nr:GspH/FimT family pseudopilin [Burkholderiaceae bacterium]